MKKLEDIRLELGYYNQAEFAKKLGLSRSYYNQLEREDKPLSNKLKYILLNNLGITEDYLKEKEKGSPVKNKNKKLFSITTDGDIKVEAVNSCPAEWNKLSLKEKRIINDMISLLTENKK